MNKLPVLIFIFLAILLSSKFTESEPAAFTIQGNDTVDINPNGSSELSLLMRKMETHAVDTRKDVLAGKLTKTFPEEFTRIYTAKPTDEHTKSPTYDPFADVYLHALNTYRTSTEQELVKNYNNIVNACLACHSQHCPGPISRIKKLLIKESEN